AVLVGLSWFAFVGGQIIAGGKLLQATTGFDLTLAIVIAGAVILAYTVMGGLKAVIYTDVFQMVILFVGIVLIGAPSLGSGSSEALGVVLVLLAMISYSVAANVAVPLTQKYHSLQVMVRVAGTALVMVLPLGLAGLRSSEFAWGSFLAVIAAGALGTGVAFVAAGALMARVGATRGSIITYIIPVVSTALGIGLLNESVAIVSVIGMLLVFAGAWLASRAEVTTPPPTVHRSTATPAEGTPPT
ncbi:MAG: EamA family transporter, partial [Acidimicrobiales bacterium]